MGKVRKVQHRSGRTTWQARWNAPDGKRRAENFATAGEAEAKLDAVQAAKRRREYEAVVPTPSEVTVAELVARTEARRRDLQDSTRNRYAAVIRNMILPHLGDRMTDELTRDEVEEWIDRKAVLYSPETVRKAWQVLSRACEAAMEAGELHRSPCSRSIRLPRLQRHHDQGFLTRYEVLAIADAIDPKYRAMVLLAGNSGLRWEEAAGLKRNRIDLTLRTVQVVQGLKGDGTLGPPKTRAARRTIRLPGSVIPEMIHHLNAYPPGEKSLVFTAPQGGPISYTNWRRRVWNPAVAKALGERVGFHALRHAHASHLVAAGVHITKRSRRGSATATPESPWRSTHTLPPTPIIGPSRPWMRPGGLMKGTQGGRTTRTRSSCFDAETVKPAATQGLRVVGATGIEPVTSAV